MTNPLLNIDFQIPFDRIRAEHVEPAVRDLLAKAKAGVDALAADTEPRTFENTMLALDRVTEPLDVAMSVIKHLEAVATTTELRAANESVEGDVSAFDSSIHLNEGLWNNLKRYAETDEAVRLTGARKRYLAKTLDAFRREGADLDPIQKKQLAEIDVELTKLTTKFSQHVLDSTNAFELILTDESRISGLPPTAVAAARESAKKKDKDGWRFTLQGPSYTAVMTYLDDASVREQLYRAYMTRAVQGEHDNREITMRVLELRGDKAKLLGYADFADFVLEDRMAHSGARAFRFLEDLKQRTEARFQAENAELERFRGAELQPWDISYYAEKLRAEKYAFEEEQLRPYFPMESVLAGMFDIVSKLYGIRVAEEAGVPAWDSQVKYYSVRDGDGTLLGAFYGDWYPRENKRPGAWMDAFITGGPESGMFKPHLGFICGNLSEPAGGKPALLTHRDVETIFHEFGHLLHHLLSKVEIHGISGTNVAWDFVELPSQIMENWCWEREALDLFARHYKTGEAIPGELFEKMKRARNFRSANAQMRQLGFGFLDLNLHVRYSPERDGNVLDYSRGILQEFSAARLPREHAMIVAFTHLFGSPEAYAAGYYSYKWAEVLDADAFTRFREHGVLSGEVGAQFRERILSKGNSEDPAELYRSFMGRDPDLNALLDRLGLMEAA